MDDLRFGNADTQDEMIRAMLRSAGATENALDLPSAEAIHAYLVGEASKEERAVVLLALRSSRTFREEFAQLALTLESLSSGDAHANFDAVQVKAAPRELIERLARGRHERSTAARSSTGRSWFADLVREVTSRRGLVAATAAVALAVTAYSVWRQSTSDPAIQLSRSVDVVNPSDLVAPGDTPRPVPLNDRDAAIQSVRDKVTFTGGELKTRPSVVPDTSLTGDSEREVFVRLLDGSGSVVTDARFRVPREATELQVWVMLLGTRELQKVPVTETAIEIRLPSGVVEVQGVLTLTYQIEGRFVSTSAETFGSQ